MSKEILYALLNEADKEWAKSYCVEWCQTTKEIYDFNTKGISPLVSKISKEPSYYYWYVAYRFCDDSDGGAYNYRGLKSEFSISTVTMEIQKVVGVSVYLTFWKKISKRQYDDVAKYLIKHEM